jgi:hypothetical protein
LPGGAKIGLSQQTMMMQTMTILAKDNNIMNGIVVIDMSRITSGLVPSTNGAFILKEFFYELSHCVFGFGIFPVGAILSFDKLRADFLPAFFATINSFACFPRKEIFFASFTNFFDFCFCYFCAPYSWIVFLPNRSAFNSTESTNRNFRLSSFHRFVAYLAWFFHTMMIHPAFIRAKFEIFFSELFDNSFLFTLKTNAAYSFMSVSKKAFWRAVISFACIVLRPNDFLITSQAVLDDCMRNMTAFFRTIMAYQSLTWGSIVNLITSFAEKHWHGTNSLLLAMNPCVGIRRQASKGTRFSGATLAVI